MKKVLLIGGGGHCLSVIDTLKSIDELTIAGIIDLEEKVGTSISGIEVIGHDSQLKELYSHGFRYAFITLGSIGDTRKRVRLYNTLKEIGFKMPSIIDTSAIISKDYNISEGVFIGKGVIINKGVTIGKCAIINTGAILEHDSVIGNFVHVAPGSTLSGQVTLRDNVHLGTNSTVIQGITIAENTLIGAGSVVVNNIGKNKKAFGNPCKEVVK